MFQHKWERFTNQNDSVLQAIKQMRTKDYRVFAIVYELDPSRQNFNQPLLQCGTYQLMIVSAPFERTKLAA